MKHIESKTLVWDIPTRLFHWLLVAVYITAYLTSRAEWYLEYHTIAGYIAGGLIIFRILWGFAGNRYARFSEFIKNWKEVKSFIAGAISLKLPRYIGHNPAVGWIVVIMLLLTAAIVTTGIITYSGEENSGVFAGIFTYKIAEIAKLLHRILVYIIIAIIVTHICAALFHDFVLRENIILSMITGKKEKPKMWEERVSHIKIREGRSIVRLAVWIIVTIMAGIGIVFIPPEGKKEFSDIGQYRVTDDKGFVVKLALNKTWKTECAASCHNGFHPTLLPAVSWKRLMANLDDHFGENVSLDETTQKEVMDYLAASSAEHSMTEASQKILRSIKKGEAPLSITKTPYWIDKHADIPAEVYNRKTIVSKGNCTACHPGAEVGSFEDKDIHIPK
ncbi:MAG: cytochrome b/b6 domain-containing protein [Deltaproteobacteria bacterium]|nr:cytochrome b/b6 domain-containing protein [Deltaproteobacteria bacterium]